MTLSAISGLLGSLNLSLGQGQERRAATPTRDDDQASAANQKRQSENTDAQQNRGPDGPGRSEWGQSRGPEGKPGNGVGGENGRWGRGDGSPGLRGPDGPGLVPTVVGAVQGLAEGLLGGPRQMPNGPQQPGHVAPGGDPGFRTGLTGTNIGPNANGTANAPAAYGPGGAMGLRAPVATPPTVGAPATTPSGPATVGPANPGLTTLTPGPGAPARTAVLPTSSGPGTPGVTVTLGQTPGQTAPGAIATQPGLLSPGQTTPGQTAPVQMNSGPMAPGQTAPSQLGQGAVPPSQATPGQAMPGQVSPIQAIPGQATPGQSATTHVAPGQTAPGQASPNQPTQISSIGVTPNAPSQVATAPGAGQLGGIASMPGQLLGAQTPSASPINIIGQSSIVVAAASQGDPAFAPVAPVTAEGQRAAAETIVARHVSAIAQADRVDGAQAAMRELRARVRMMPTGSAAEVTAMSSETIARAARSFGSGQPIERIERVTVGEREAPGLQRMAADLAAAVDSGSSHPQGAHVAKEVAQAIANAERMPLDRLIAFGSGVAFGTGLALPLALIDAYRERGDRDASDALEAALIDGLGKLMRRLAEAVRALARSSGPVAFEWAAWRAEGVAAPEIEKRLRARLSGEAGLLDEIDAALAAVETAGLDAVNALERLSRWGGGSPTLLDMWRSATSAPETLFAIAQSLSAQHVVVQRLLPGLAQEPEEQVGAIDAEAARSLYASFGFARPEIEILTDVTLARHTVVQMGGGWMRARRARDPGSEAAFARLLAYLEGLGTPENRHIETIGFADLDPEGQRPETIAGAPLMQRLELDLTARDLSAA
jgi:hypothetical protein